MHNINDIIQQLESVGSLTIQESFDLARICSSSIDADSDFSRRLTINILNNWDKIPADTHEIWGEIIESHGFYPYLSKENINIESTPSKLRYALSESRNLSGRVFHDEQKKVVELLYAQKNVVVSAPTSFGKSLLIEEIIASERFKQIIVIQPTLALLDETRRKLLKYSNSYKIIVRTSQEPSEKLGNIFLFTAERVNEYEHFFRVDFLIIDEFYKLSGRRDDERSSSLNNAFYKIYNLFKPQFYFLGPNIDNVSEDFLNTFNAVFYKSNYTLVDSRTINVYEENRDKFGSKGKKKIFKENTLFSLLTSLNNEQTIVYCSSPDRVRKLAKQFINYLVNENIKRRTDQLPLSEWIRINISDKWMLLDALDYQIGIHDGALQKHITTTIIDYFNEGRIHYLFCTSTIIEGVNTSAKNIIYFDSKKGGTDIDYFDYSNIKGRAGRLMEHYVGNIYNFNQPPMHENISIDIPFVDQNPIKDEILIQLSQEHVKNRTTKQYIKIEDIPQEERNIIKRNGINVFGQKKIIDTLMSELDMNRNKYIWNAFPTYEQLDAILKLGWDNFVNHEDGVRQQMTQGRLLNFTWKFIKNKDESYMINEYVKYFAQKHNKYLDPTDIFDSAILQVFQIIRHWMQYKVPKWLAVINELQSYVCTKKGIMPGNYKMLANLLENGFIDERLSIMIEYGIPPSAIKKLTNHIPKDIGQDAVMDFIKDNQLIDKVQFIRYERDKILENI